MLLSVVIPSLNKFALLARTLGALREQKLGRDGEWEVVVVNDGSTDGTADYLAGLQDWRLPALRVVSPPQNVGRARARNQGAQAARGRYLLFLDDDIIAPPGLVAAHLDVLADHPDCGTIGYAVTDPDLIDGPHLRYLDTRGAARLAEGPAPGRFFVTQNAAVPRKVFLDIGGFDEGFSTYGFEDMEVAFRLEEEGGLRFRALPQPVPRHVHHHTSAEYFAKKVECGRHSLPHLARLHPDRIRAMQLHHVVDTAQSGQCGWVSRMIRGLAESSFGRDLPILLTRWPSLPGHRPLWAGFYFRLMNLAVLCAFRQGLTETDTQN
jgi:GT2 family glycosyltransferase